MYLKFVLEYSKCKSVNASHRIAAGFLNAADEPEHQSGDFPLMGLKMLNM